MLVIAGALCLIVCGLTAYKTYREPHGHDRHVHAYSALRGDHDAAEEHLLIRKTGC
jgi:hypothetical protein